MLVIVAGFLLLGWWQLTRAEGGNALSWGYTFEWPLFAGFVVVFWIRVMRDELRESRASEAASGPAAGGDVPGGLREVPAAVGASSDGQSRIAGAAGHNASGAEDGDEDAELAAYNAYLRRLNEEASRAAGSLAARRARRRSAAWSAHPGGAARPDGTGGRDGAGGARRGPQLGH